MSRVNYTVTDRDLKALATYYGREPGREFTIDQPEWLTISFLEDGTWTVEYHTIGSPMGEGASGRGTSLAEALAALRCDDPRID